LRQGFMTDVVDARLKAGHDVERFAPALMKKAEF
jgi:hypothetical protein